jgi:EAL domain-containing protein (putative c-di-GMP-specific phosphodiesterase class I)
MTVAEGIECAEEVDAVNDLGVDAMQGFFIGMPSPEIAPDLFD